MNKEQFLEQLRKGLSGLPQEDIEECLMFYSEMIDDRIEEGVSQQEAVSKIGPVSEIIKQAVADAPIIKIAKQRIKPKRRLRTGEIILIILGSPIWLSLLISAIAVVLSVYASLWAVIVCLWAVFASLIACFAGSVVACVAFSICGKSVSGCAILGAGLICAGLSIFLLFGCKAATKGVLMLARKIAIFIKKLFLRKEKA